jgi:hypothetical protein
MLKPICVPCQRFYRPKKNGFYFVEGMPLMNKAEPGKRDANLWGPYKLWCGDLWVCEGCGHEIVVGVGRNPLAEHYQPDFAAHVESFNAKLQVNDC